MSDTLEAGRSAVEAAEAPDQQPAKEVDVASHKSTTRVPSFQFYPSDFLSGDKVARMSYTEIGIYIVLLSQAWLSHGLPPQTTEIAKILKMNPQRFARVWSGVLSEAFVLRSGRLVNLRQESERKKQNEFRARQAANGSKGGRPSGKGLGSSGLTHSKARALQSVDRSPVSNLSSEEGLGETNPPLDGQSLFAALIAAYPEERVTDNQPTQHEFIEALGPYAEWQSRFDLMLATLAAHKASDQWRRGVIPNLITWLKRGDWRGTRKLALAATGTDGRGRTGAPPAGKYDGLEES